MTGAGHLKRGGSMSHHRLDIPTCAHEFTAEECYYAALADDSWPRPDLHSVEVADEGCEYCKEHCHKRRCWVHKGKGESHAG
jgi:hypothetical protein